MLAWLEVIEKEVPALTKPFAILRAAASGKEFIVEDYRSGMQLEQESWRLGGVVSRSWKRWQQLFPKRPFLSKVLKDGIKWEWLPEAEQRQVLTELEKKLPRAFAPVGEKAASLESFVKDGIKQGFVRISPDQSPNGWLKLIFSQPKPNGTLRWLVDLSELNRLTVKVPFKMSGINDIRRIPTGAFMTCLDYRKFYWLFALEKETVKTQRFVGPQLSAADQRQLVESGAKRSWVARPAAASSLPPGAAIYEFPVVGMGNRQAAVRTCEYPIAIVGELTLGSSSLPMWAK